MDATVRLREDLVEEALKRGFVAAGVASVRPFGTARQRALDAVWAGRMDGMPWYTAERVVASTDLGARYPWARSLLALAWPYRPAARPGTPPARPPAAVRGRPRGRMAAYACLAGPAGGPADYHTVLGDACDGLAAWLGERVPGLRTKRFVDHGWALDRPVAERGGLGFAGKNSFLLTPQAGSYVLLAEMLLGVDLPPSPRSRRGCGTCTACMPSCPTGAIVAPGVVDARRCIAYLTIEHRGPIPHGLRPLIGTWAFGCDLCQEACPINRRRAPEPLDGGTASTAHGPVPFPDLVECLEMDADTFRERFRRTAVWRTGRTGLARNAAIALGNAGDAAALPALRRAADTDEDAVVREAAAWAVARLEPSSDRPARGGAVLTPTERARWR